jgi:hypothetical protein
MSTDVSEVRAASIITTAVHPTELQVMFVGLEASQFLRLFVLAR